MLDVAVSWACLIPFEAEIDACWSCWLKVALSAMIDLDIDTVAASTEAKIKLEQSWGLFCRSSRGAGVAVMTAS